MNIKGLHRVSLIDYPGRICTTVFVGGCNMRCRYCYNVELAVENSARPTIRYDVVLKFLESRKHLVDGVVITGGEPTVSKNLVQFLCAVKNLGFEIKIDTNGSKPDVILALLKDNLIDYIALDIKTSPSKYGLLTGKSNGFARALQTLDHIRSYNVDYEVRTTCIPTYVEFDDLKEIVSAIGKVKKYYLQQFLNNDILDQSMSEIAPFSNDILESYKSYLKNYAQVCEIRGL